MRRRCIIPRIPLLHSYLVACICSNLRTGDSSDRRPDKRPYVTSDIIVYGISDRSAEKPSDKSAYLGPYASPVFPAHILHRSASCQNQQRHYRI